MSVIYMIRHGQASFEGNPYDRLSELGRTQCDILGEHFSRMGVRFDAAYSGSLRRQRESAEHVLERMATGKSPDVKILPELNEYDSQVIIASQLPAMISEDPTLAEDAKRMSERQSFQRVFEGAMLRWVSGLHHTEDVETWPLFSSRVREAIGRIMAENGRKRTVAVFTSGGPICAAVQMAIGVSGEVGVRLNWQVRNTSVSEFKYNDEGIFLTSFNSVHHLQFRKEPALLTYR